MYIKEVDDMLLKDKIQKELNNLSYLIDLDELEKIINNDRECIKEYEEEVKETELEIKEETQFKPFAQEKHVGKFKEVLIALFERILEDNREYIKARRRTNKYFRNLVEILKEDIKKK